MFGPKPRQLCVYDAEEEVSRGASERAVRKAGRAKADRGVGFDRGPEDQDVGAGARQIGASGKYALIIAGEWSVGLVAGGTKSAGCQGRQP